MGMKDVLDEEIKRISFSSQEISKMRKVADEFVNSLKKKGIRAVVGGSLAKGTMVRKAGLSEVGSLVLDGHDPVGPDLGVRSANRAETERQDVDVFVVFDSDKDIVKLGKVLKGIKLPGVLKEVHGSRDYFQVDCGLIVLEAIPVLKNTFPEDAINVTDVSLSHVKYVVDEIKKNPKIADEIKLAKAFCRAQGCYGAEGYVHGFSGYSLEILVIYFGGFINFLKRVGRVSVIDPKKYFRNSNEVMREINSSKLNSPIVLVDPTYKYRNVCAGLGLETYERFLVVGSNFLKKPSLDFFERKDFDVESFRLNAGKGRRFVEVDLETDRQEGDIAGTKMKKFFDFFIRELERKGQVVVNREFIYSGSGQKAKGYLIVIEKGEIEIRGPSIGLEGACKAFRKANKDVVKKGKYLFRKEKVSVEGVFEKCLEVGSEMGGWGKLVSLQ